jgi:hypothetical protein
VSYLHCPTCQRAYNLAANPVCPYCPIPASQVDPSEDIVVAAEQLARAMARATPTERTAATQRLEQLALPAPGAKPASFHGGMLRAIRDAIEPPPPPKPAPMLAALAYAVVERITERAMKYRYPRFLLTKLQLTSFQNSSMNFGRALR